MGENCDKGCNKESNKQSERSSKNSFNNLKSSIFCGTKGFLTFNLAFLSYLEYGIHNYIL